MFHVDPVNLLMDEFLRKKFRGPNFGSIEKLRAGLVNPVSTIKKTLGINDVLQELVQNTHPRMASALYDVTRSQQEFMSNGILKHVDGLLSLYKLSAKSQGLDRGLFGFSDLSINKKYGFFTEAYGSNKLLSDCLSQGLTSMHKNEVSWNSDALGLMNRLSFNQTVFKEGFSVYSNTNYSGKQGLNLFNTVNSALGTKLGKLAINDYAGFSDFRTDISSIPEAGNLLDDIFEEVEEIERNGIGSYGQRLSTIESKIQTLLQLTQDSLILTKDQRTAFLNSLVVLVHYIIVYVLPIASFIYSYHLSDTTEKKIITLEADIQTKHKAIIENQEEIKQENQSILNNQQIIMEASEKLMESSKTTEINVNELGEQIDAEFNEVKKSQNEIMTNVDSILGILRHTE